MRDNTGLGLGYRFAWRLEYIGVSCFGKACCVDHWNHFTDKYKDAVCDDCDCCDCCDCCDL